jgi:hypothetical protein
MAWMPAYIAVSNLLSMTSMGRHAALSPVTCLDVLDIFNKAQLQPERAQILSR